ncbi:thioredoxin-like protein [Protomyces lactucae-debilis]|uniref:Thioredoxin-like protein n=1 Tax=Protomyces lactucae-debilis TaxID=2754530 RepID=A0A1Y2F8R5_PROLT|nr:thioredoxin-like protein [Protomyces lactucae-debilis]ORY80308.1 thioredoxin-like protein [Protomyces lactucae-debilis]
MPADLRPRTVRRRPTKRLYFLALAFVSLLIYFLAFSSSESAPNLIRDEASAAARDAETHKLVHDLKQAAADGVATVKDVARDAARKVANKGKAAVAYDPAAALQEMLSSYQVILFSKSYCPYCKKAKAVLEKYTISPSPLIFELDIEKHGAELQGELAKLTGRSTVPNLVVGKTSLGGSEEIVALDKSGKLASAFKEKSAEVKVQLNA